MSSMNYTEPGSDLVDAFVINAVRENALKALKNGTDDYASAIWNHIESTVTEQCAAAFREKKYIDEAATVEALGAELCDRLNCPVPDDQAAVGTAMAREPGITEIAKTALTSIAGHYHSQILPAVIDGVIADVHACADRENYTEGDVKLAVGRVICGLLGTPDE